MQKGEVVFNHLGPLASAVPQASAVDAWTALVAPGDVFRQPREVLAHPALSHGEKRAILASWASDAHAVESSPSLRCLPGSKAEIVPLDTVLAALSELDGGGRGRSAKRPAAKSYAERRQRSFWNIRQAFRPRRPDDDDDPPPCPVAARPQPRPPAPITEAVAAFA